MYLFSVSSQLVHQEVQQGSGNVLVFLGQGHSNRVGVDVEWTNDYGLRERCLHLDLASQVTVDLSSDVSCALLLFTREPPE